MKLFYIYSLVFILACLRLEGQVTTEGRDFWLGFMDNLRPATAELYFSSSKVTEVKITSPLNGYEAVLQVVPNETTVLSLPDEFIYNIEGISDLAIHITSNEDISVFALNKSFQSADAAVILPTKALGNEYIVVSHKESNSQESELLIVATENQTHIEIIPSADTYGGWEAGTPVEVIMNAGQTYQLKSDGDLSGTIVRLPQSSSNECTNFAVFGGSRMTFVGECGFNQDHLFEQMFPTSTWGKEFLYVPFKSRIGGDMLKLVAIENNTRVSISGLPAFSMNSGQVIKMGNTLDGVRSISADKPISAVQFARSQDCDGQSGDPFMLVLSPMEQKINNITFSAFEGFEINQYYLNLITDSGSQTGILLDGQDMSSSFKVFERKAYATINISAGNHHLIAPEGVIAYVYGFGNIESYGYSAGVSLDNVNLSIAASDTQTGTIERLSCYGDQITFTAIVETDASSTFEFTNYTWDFGDGNYAEGEIVDHMYQLGGTYDVKLIASDENGECSNSEIAFFTIEIAKPEVKEIIGSISVCSEAQNIEYSAEVVNAEKYFWSIIGGSIQGNPSETQISVNWGKGNPDANVSLYVIGPEGCFSEEYSLPVLIDNRLQPATPQGSNYICFSEKEAVQYRVTRTNGSIYQWFISNGEIIGADNSNEVLVKWLGEGIGEIWYKERNLAISDCEGESDKISVKIASEISVEEKIQNVSCLGGSDGIIELAVTGGEGPYFYEWNNGIASEENKIGNLVSGIYSVVITDSKGCDRIANFEVTEPEELEATMTLSHVKCFGGSDGEAIVNVTGGTEPYQFFWNGSNTGSGSILTQLSKGTYRVKVLDDNNCDFDLSFDIIEPEILSATTIDSPTCPENNTGSILVDAKGGTAPYTYRWNLSPPRDSQLIEELSAGIYSVTVTDANGCSLTLEDRKISEKYPIIRVPNAFSPNNDGINDDFNLVYECSVQKIEIVIYNRWGQVIYSSNDIEMKWDGTFKGQMVPSGNYPYTIAFTTIFEGEPFQNVMRGKVYVVR
jgi:gliding motility-associated-like protein